MAAIQSCEMVSIEGVSLRCSFYPRSKERNSNLCYTPPATPGRQENVDFLLCSSPRAAIKSNFYEEYRDQSLAINTPSKEERKKRQRGTMAETPALMLQCNERLQQGDDCQDMSGLDAGFKKSKSPPCNEDVSSFLNRIHKMQQAKLEAARKRWNFDFEEDSPVTGRWEWREVNHEPTNHFGLPMDPYM